MYLKVQKVLEQPLHTPRARLQDLERAYHVLRDGHDRRRVIELATIIGGREYRHELPLRLKLVAAVGQAKRRVRLSSGIAWM